MVATSWALRWFSLEEERVMQQSSVSISLIFENQGINPVGDNAQVAEYLHKQSITCDISKLIACGGVASLLKIEGESSAELDGATSWACVGFSLEEERVMQQSRVSISLSFENQGINPVGDYATSHRIPAQTNTNLQPTPQRGCQSLNDYSQSEIW